MPKIKDETGNRYGKLLVLKIDESTIESGKRKKWVCQCDCGKQISVNGTSLRNGNTKSCGCTRTQKLVERNINNSSVKIGNKYGKLTIIQDLGMRKQSSRNKNERWSLCKCDCGKTIEVSNNMLQTGWKKSCGCLSTSYGENCIKRILDNENIQYITEYRIDDLYYKSVSDKLRFDFAIFENNKLSYLIEFDGKQHFKDENNWNNLKDTFNERVERDNLKNNYCKEKNIPLIRIPYTKYNTITINDLKVSTTKFLI